MAGCPDRRTGSVSSRPWSGCAGRAATGWRFFDLEAPSGWPIYVHSKVCVIDDVWMIVGSDNLNIRSWTNDSELSCAVIDDQRDEREPVDPGGRGDGARVLARETRLRLWREHLGPRATATTPTSSTVSAGSSCCAGPPPTSTRGTSDGRTGHVRPAGYATTARDRCAGGRRGGPSRCTACSSTRTDGRAGSGVAARFDRSAGWHRNPMHDACPGR